MKIFKKKKKDTFLKERPLRDKLSRSSRKLSSYFEYVTPAKFFSMMAIIYYIFSDFAAVCELLLDRSFDMDPGLAAALSVTVATLLDGFPLIMSFGMSSFFEKKKVRESASKQKLALFISTIGVLITFAAVIGFRVLIIYITLDPADKAAIEEIMIQGIPLSDKLTESLSYIVFVSEEPEGFAKNVLLALLPILTSLFCMSDTFAYLSPSYLQRQREKLSKLYKKMTDAQVILNDRVSKLKSAKLALWNELNITTEFPEENTEDSKIFVNKCIQRGVTNTRRRCVHLYEMEIERYNKSVESVIRNCLIEMSKRSTVPQLISDLDLDEIIGRYDKNRQGAESWSYSKFISYSVPKLRCYLEDEDGDSSSYTGKNTGGGGIVGSQIVEVGDFGSFEEKTVLVPDIAGSHIDYAKQLLADAGLDYEVRFIHNNKPAGTVIEYDPKNKMVEKDTLVRVIVSSGPEAQQEQEQVQAHVEPEQPQQLPQPQAAPAPDFDDSVDVIAASEKIVHPYDGRDADEEKKNTQKKESLI